MSSHRWEAAWEPEGAGQESGGGKRGRPAGLQDHAESSASAAQRPRRWHQGFRRQSAHRESLEFQGSFPARDAGAGLMSAPWTPAPHQTAVNDPILSRP